MSLSDQAKSSSGELQEIRYRSEGDGTDQPAKWLPPARAGEPLVVGLHHWSTGYHHAQSDEYAAQCQSRGWAMIYPHFRGSNERPEACGSELVVADVLSAVRFGIQQGCDARRVFLLGGSGGGHCSLLMAGRAPGVWAGVSAWVPISDVRAWHAESLVRQAKYARMIEACCGGPPDCGTPACSEALLRSPLTWLHRADGVPIDINAGITDGHTGSVPVSQSLRAFNVLADPADRLTGEQIEFFVTRQAVPPGLEFSGSDPLYGQKRVLFRRQSRQVRVTIFAGGHEQVTEAAMAWFQSLPPRR